MEENREISPLNYDLHEPDDFEELLMSLSEVEENLVDRSTIRCARVCSIFTVDMAKQCHLNLRGLKRDVARRNHNAGVKLTEGKEPLSFSVLRYFCATFLKHNDTEFVFAHTFLLLSWNLMCRAGNTASIHSGHLSWDGDVLAILFGHMKNDQDGTRPRDARHVYANPFIPEICPVLSLAIYGAVLGLSNSKLFPGGNQYDRFSKILKRVMETEEMKEILANEGLISERILFEKGLQPLSLRAPTGGGPSAAAICIRAGWTLPGVQDTYIRYESAGDRIVGRYVAGLPFDYTGFAILPPFFPDVDEFVRANISLCFNNLPPHLLQTGGFLLASLVYHCEYVRKVLGPQHPLYRNPVFGNVELVSQLKQRVTCRTAWPSDRIRPTGVPPHRSSLPNCNDSRNRWLN
ncbi:LOW QUALITY PROTEIN: hypothetical protein PHMEG_00017813 [Phytophthora megakarya]|uniref:Uncharacterized protein n=1 Tax=Phytophthora megakarya TaxID=4795 RepID=A0A225VVC8_9STRA|nr:LOW QUALITY PROTEIN: hypothetical protein PHMEG_00017813 [Phytophthora megakarya]